MDACKIQQWEVEAVKELVDLFQTSFDEIWPALTSLYVDKSDLETGITQRSNLDTFDFFQRLLSASDILPGVGVTLSAKVLCRIQKSASGLLKLFCDSNSNSSNGNDALSLEMINLLKILQMHNEILEYFTQTTDFGIKSELFMSVKNAASTLFEDLLKFLSHERAKDLEKAVYIRLLVTGRKIWTFFKSRSSEHQIVQRLVSTIEIKKLQLFTRNPNASLFLRFSTEMLGKVCVEVDWKSILILNLWDDQFLSMLIPLIEIQPSIVDSEVIYEVRNALLSKDTERRKEAAFIIKSMSSILAVREGESAVSSSEMLRHLGQSKFINFWSTFFDLYEILDEKQSHIVQPVLLSKLVIFDQPDTLTCNWFFVILSKMIHHDNRHIAKDGFLRFMNNRVRDEENDMRKSIFEKFLLSEVLPFLKEHAGWILSEPQEFFQTVKTFGYFLQQLYRDELLMVEKVVGFIVQENKCLSPASLYFLILSLHHGIKSGPGLAAQVSTEKDGKLDNCMALISQCTTQGLTTVDKFLRLRVEDIFVHIVSRWGKDLGRISAADSSDSSVPQILFKLFTFIGSLSSVTVIDNNKTRAKLTNIVADVGDQYKNEDDTFSLVLGPSKFFNQIHVRAVFRWRWIRSLNNPIQSAKIIEETIKRILGVEFVEINFKIDDLTGFHLGMNDFIRGLGKSFQIPEESPGFDKILEILKNECTSGIKEASQLALTYYPRLKFIEVIMNYLEKHINLPLKLVSIENMLSALESSDKDNQSSMACHTILWKLVGVLPDKFDPELVQKLIDTFSSTGFERLKWTATQEVNFTSEFYKIKFDGLTHVLDRLTEKRVGTVETWKKCIATALDDVEKAGPGGVTSAMKFFTATLSFYNNLEDTDGALREMVNDFTDLAWKLVFEMRKSESFWSGIREFVNMITHAFFGGQGVLTKFSERIFKQGESVTGLPLVLVQKLVDRFNMTDLTSIDFGTREIEEITQVCLTAVLFGPALMKTNRVTFGIWAHLNSKDSVDVLQDDSTFGSNARTRVMGVWILQRLAAFQDMKAIKAILVVLLDKSDEESVTRKRYFGNSQTHRMKQRISQTILMLQPYLDLELSRLVLKRLMGSLTTDSPQPSVRYLCEWTIILILLKHPELWKLFFETSTKCCTKRIGFGAFFSTICLHTSTNIQSVDSKIEEQFFFEKSLSSLSELILGHHVTVRVYAQACFREIYKIVERKGWTLLKTKYSLFNDTLDAASLNAGGNFSKLFEAVSKDFYLQIFNAVTHSVPEVIFIYLPRLSDVADDELPLESYFTSTMRFCHFSSGNPKELKSMYKKYDNLAWHLKATAGDGREMGEEVPGNIILENPTNTEESSSLVNFQKKINPWKSLSIVDQIDDFSIEFLTKKRSAMEDGLIVVASLIDKIPNLGGLCRSCEIFGVSKYVIPSLKILQDQNFVSLSVSAHNWVEVLEVPPRDLEVFISTYAAKGYTILGVEQALESTRLNDFQFPRKSLLLLGNEKYGIPTNLLHLVDQCIEIPQVGIVRSLNVHVTGALCIWQYAAQHAI